jgi:hypothetical protein
MTPIYFTATVVDNLDPDELGRLSLIIPGITGADDPHPDWIPPRVTPGAGPASGWFYVPPVDAVVVVELDAGGALRWTGGTWGAVNTIPEFLADNYPRRSGFTSPEGGHTFALDEDDGAYVLVASGGRLVVTTDPELGAAVEPVILGATFLTDLAAGLTEVLAAVSMLGLPATNLGTWIGNAQASTGGTGAPYLSAITFTE